MITPIIKQKLFAMKVSMESARKITDAFEFAGIEFCIKSVMVGGAGNMSQMTGEKASV